MSDIKIEDLKCIACGLIENNQGQWSTSDSKENFIYSLAFNDGALALLKEIQIRYFRKVAADGKSTEK